MNSLSTTLQRFEGLLRRQRAPLASLLRPPATRLQLDALEAAVGASLPDDARTWWRWHDGASGGHWWERSFAAPGELLSTQQALALRQARLQTEATYRGKGWPEMWKRSWVPLAHAAHGADLVVDSGGGVYVFDPLNAESTKPRASSLASVVELWVHLLESGQIRWDETGEWSVEELPGDVAWRALL